MGDRIETGTFCVLATLAKGNLIIKNFNPNLIQTELNILKKIGAKIKTSKAICKNNASKGQTIRKNIF